MEDTYATNYKADVEEVLKKAEDVHEILLKTWKNWQKVLKEEQNVKREIHKIMTERMWKIDRGDDKVNYAEEGENNERLRIDFEDPEKCRVGEEVEKYAEEEVECSLKHNTKTD